MRYRLLDTARGFSLVSMILFHACWDLVYLFGYDWPWFVKTQGYLWQQSICWMFILVSGFCMGLKEERAPQSERQQGLTEENRMLRAGCKRGLKVLAAAILITVATLLFSPETKIVFGVLFFLGVSMILTETLRPTLWKISPKIGMLCSGFLFFVLRNINEGSLGFENMVLCRLPDFLYEQGMLATFFGLRDKSFSSADYFSLFPWYFLFLEGFFLCRSLLRNHAAGEQPGLPRLFMRGNSALAAVGRHSLLIYLLHQPIILLILSVAFGAVKW
ncbi:MAG: DUF1624 domain-containing protein [Acidaminococcaceae bacterium]|nr:DUF1624 domain-containing protein [Acidaminococcaceae bacterium]